MMLKHPLLRELPLSASPASPLLEAQAALVVKVFGGEIISEARLRGLERLALREARWRRRRRPVRGFSGGVVVPEVSEAGQKPEKRPLEDAQNSLFGWGDNTDYYPIAPAKGE